ncbi:unnamed protein product, partial [Prorocentrum cordatum]
GPEALAQASRAARGAQDPDRDAMLNATEYCTRAALGSNIRRLNGEIALEQDQAKADEFRRHRDTAIARCRADFAAGPGANFSKKKKLKSTIRAEIHRMATGASRAAKHREATATSATSAAKVKRAAKRQWAWGAEQTGRRQGASGSALAPSRGLSEPPRGQRESRPPRGQPGGQLPRSGSYPDLKVPLGDKTGDAVFSLKQRAEAERGRVDVGVDSRAATSCIPEDNAASWPLLRSTGPPPTRALPDIRWRCSAHASRWRGSKHSSLACKPLVLAARKPQDDSQRSVTLRALCPLRMSLFAFSELITSCKVAFDAEEHGGSRMENSGTGSNIQIYQRNGVFVIPVCLKVKPPAKMIAAQWGDRLETDPFTGLPLKAQGQPRPPMVDEAPLQPAEESESLAREPRDPEEDAESDQEIAIAAVIRAAKNARAGELTPEAAPKESHEKSNGAAEVTAQQVRGLARAPKEQLEDNAGDELPRKHPALAWLTGHKLESRWAPGVYHGIRRKTSEKLAGTVGRAYAAQSVRGRPRGEARGKALLLSIRGAPRPPNPRASDAAELPPLIELAPELPDVPTGPAAAPMRKGGQRRLYITNSDVHGPRIATQPDAQRATRLDWAREAQAPMEAERVSTERSAEGAASALAPSAAPASPDADAPMPDARKRRAGEGAPPDASGDPCGSLMGLGGLDAEGERFGRLERARKCVIAAIAKNALDTGNPRPVCEEPGPWDRDGASDAWDRDSCWELFYDDVSGKLFGPAMVQEARASEIQFVDDARAVIALSSGEAEYHGLVAGCSEGLGDQSTAKYVGAYTTALRAI